MARYLYNKNQRFGISLLLETQAIAAIAWRGGLTGSRHKLYMAAQVNIDNASYKTERHGHTHMGSAEVRTPLIELLDARLAAMEAKSEARHKELEKKLGDSRDFNEFLKYMRDELFGILSRGIDRSK